MYRPWLTWVVALVLGCLVARARGAPLEPGTVGESYESGGVTLTAADIRQIAGWGEGASGARGGGIGRVFLVACSGEFGFPTIQSAIDEAVDGDAVVVFPNDCTPAGRWYENIDFLGKAIRVQSANPADEAIVDATVIDGGFSEPVVRFESGETTSSTLDGVTLANGSGSNESSGGGVTCVGAGPTIRRCVFKEMFYQGWSALGFQQSESARVESCRFEDSVESAFALFVACSQDLRFTDCEFDNTSSLMRFMTAHLVPCPSLELDVTFDSCRFTKNVLLSAPHYAITFNDCDFVDMGNLTIRARDLLMSDCHLEGNTNVRIQAEKEATVERTTFNANHAGSLPLLAAGVSIALEDCDFIGNEVTGQSLIGAPSVGTMTRCNFVDNVSVLHLVSFAVQGPPPNVNIRRCSFRGNTSNAAIFRGNLGYETPGEMSDCAFVGNQASDAIVTLFGGSVRNTLVAGNRLTSAYYGAVTVFSSLIEGSAIVGNHGGASAVRMEESQAVNSIIYDNRYPYQGSELPQVSRGYNLEYCNVEHLAKLKVIAQQPAAPAFVGCIDLPPQFVDPGSWDDMGTPDDYADDVYTLGDYHLLAESPCIDGGDPAYVPAMGETDFDGEPRVVSCRVDMGVDEFPQDPIALAGDFNSDGDVTIDDVSAFLETVLSPVGIGICRADLNGDGFADGLDVAAMAALLLGM